LKQDIAYFDANIAGAITSRLTNDTNQMTDPVSILMNNMVSNLLLLAGGLFMCFHTSWKLAILAMSVIFPSTYLVRTYSEWAGKIARKISDEMSEANGVATQAIQNMRTVRYFGAESFELGRYSNNLNNVYKLQLRDNVTRIANSTLTRYLDLGVGVFVLWYGGGVIIGGDQSHFSLGQLITFQLYWNMMKQAFNGLNDVLSQLLRATAASQRIMDLLDLNPTIETGRGEWLGRESGEEMHGTICFNNVSFSYAQKRSKKPVLDTVNLKLPGGQVTAIVGKSGSGKSTMASLLLRLYDPVDGAITLDGRDFRDFEPQSLRGHFGVVAQETQLFAGTIEENISYAMPTPYTKADLEVAAAKANALEFVQGFDDGFQTLVGDRGMLLSGGQKQRLSIARMFLRRPRLLLLDEATSALDAENEALVQEALDGLVASGVCRTVVVIAHRLSTVRNADQIVVMQDGELKELGKHEELLRMDGIYAQLVQRQLQGKDSAKGKEDRKSGDSS
jgi:ABC-type multidrug transport system fused ATPase/permease subunit